jgi:hypothetical protein
MTSLKAAADLLIFIANTPPNHGVKRTRAEMNDALGLLRASALAAELEGGGGVGVAVDDDDDPPLLELPAPSAPARASAAAPDSVAGTYMMCSRVQGACGGAPGCGGLPGGAAGLVAQRHVALIWPL